MTTIATDTILEHPFQPVKSQFNTQLPLFSDSMIHHKVSDSRSKKRIVYYRGYIDKAYGVSSSRRVLSPQLLLKKFDYIRDCLDSVLGLTLAQREVTLRLLTFWAYYGNVYPKEATITAQPGCSKASFWRTIRLLQELGLIQVINRYIIRPHAQISNLYRFDKLLILIARYLAEHGTQFYEKWLKPYLAMPGSQFWGKALWLQKSELAFPHLQERGHYALL